MTCGKDVALIHYRSNGLLLEGLLHRGDRPRIDGPSDSERRSAKRRRSSGGRSPRLARDGMLEAAIAYRRRRGDGNGWLDGLEK